MDLRHERTRFRSANKRLRRGRRLYVYLIRFTVVDTESLHRAARRMKDGGLYAESTLDKDVQWSILRKLWQIWCSHHGHAEWHSWLVRRGWCQPRYGQGWVRKNLRAVA